MYGCPLSVAAGFHCLDLLEGEKSDESRRRVVVVPTSRCLYSSGTNSLNNSVFAVLGSEPPVAVVALTGNELDLAKYVSKTFQQPKLGREAHQSPITLPIKLLPPSCPSIQITNRTHKRLLDYFFRTNNRLGVHPKAGRDFCVSFGFSWISAWWVGQEIVCAIGVLNWRVALREASVREKPASEKSFQARVAFR